MLRFLDSGDTYNTDVGGGAKWTTYNATSVAGGRNGRGIELGENLSRTIDYQANWVVGWAIIFNEGVGFATSDIYALLSNGIALATVRTQADGTLALYAGNSLNIIGFSPSIKALHLNTWYYIEVKLALSGGPGTISVTGSLHVNNVEFIPSNSAVSGVAGSSLTINDSKANQHLFFPSNISGTTVIDDIYIADSQAGFVTDFVGDLAILALYAIGDVTTDWNTTGTPHYAQINEQYAEASPRTYIYSNNPGDIDNFNFQPVTPFSGGIIGVQYCAYMKKDAEGSRLVELTVGPTGSFELLGSAISPSDSYVYFLLCMDTDPNTEAQWTQAGFDATQFGVKIIS